MFTSYAYVDFVCIYATFVPTTTISYGTDIIVKPKKTQSKVMTQCNGNYKQNVGKYDTLVSFARHTNVCKRCFFQALPFSQAQGPYFLEPRTKARSKCHFLLQHHSNSCLLLEPCGLVFHFKIRKNRSEDDMKIKNTAEL